MMIASYDRLIGFDDMTFQPFTRYVMSEATFQTIARNLNDRGQIVSTSCFNDRTAFRRGRIKERRVGVYRHTAFGDQLIMTGITAWLRHVWPDARIFYFCAPLVTDIWRWNPHIEFCGGPMTLEFADAMTDHIMYEGMFENDGEPDQLNCYDSHLRAAGFDHKKVPARFKRPYIFFNQKEEMYQAELRGKHGDYIVYHWSSSNLNRMYPPAQSLATLQLLLERIQIPIIVVGTCDDEEAKLYKLPEGCVDLRNKTPKFRQIMNMVAASALVIGPDSSVVHVAGGLAKHCISLWGLFHPNDRIKYYENAHPIVGFKSCPHAPCRNHEFKLPEEKCYDAGNTVSPPEFCNALRSIAPLQIVNKAYHILSNDYSTNKQSKPIPANRSDASVPTTGGSEISTVRGTEVGEDHFVRRDSERTSTSI